ncbi:hypothetical protein [Corynebacterium sp. H130]|uniref:hypothetical protein n=1 Tax=Corynebacterium sp. H130 TaxID=3133444 RepID=UPI00309EBFDF
MGTRQLFVLLNTLAAVFTPPLIFLGRMLGQNGGWILFLLMLGGFLIYHVAYLILLVFSIGLPKTKSPNHEWLVVTWVLGFLGTYTSILTMPDAGDTVESKTFFGPLNDIPVEQAEAISSVLYNATGIIGLAAFAAWLVLVIKEILRVQRARRENS